MMSMMKKRPKPEKPKTLEELLQLAERDPKLPMITLSQLREHKETKPIWVCLKGVVYDVSSNHVYDPKQGYAVFAGECATMALGTMLFDKVGRQEDWRRLDREHLECVDEWVWYYEQRYPKVGYLIEEYKRG